jgi:hypothetical protein
VIRGDGLPIRPTRNLRARRTTLATTNSVQSSNLRGSTYVVSAPGREDWRLAPDLPGQRPRATVGVREGKVWQADVLQLIWVGSEHGEMAL